MFEFLGGPAVTLAYYLFKLFGIEAALFISWGQWQRNISFRARRLTIVFGSLTVLQLMLLFVSLVSRTALWGIPFERMMGVASLGFLIWGFTPTFRTKETLGNWLLLGNTILAFFFYFLAFFFWDGKNFNQSNWETFFVLWEIALAIFGAVDCSTKLNDERMYALFSFGTMLVGYLLHFFLASAYPVANIPISVRVAEMIAYPLLAIAIYQGAFQSLVARTQEFENLSQISLGQIKGLISLFEATRQITSSLELSQVLDGAAKSIANAIKADQCAIAIPDDEADMNQLRLVSIYNPSRKGRGESVSFPVNDQPAIKHVLKRNQQIQIDDYQDDNHLQLLFALMGANNTGPMLVQPLLRQDTPMGVVILGNSVSKRVFTTAESELCKSLTDQVSVAIQHAKEHTAVSGKAQQLSWTLRNQELEAGKRRAAMETELKKSREEVALFAQRLYEYEVEKTEKTTQLTQAQERVSKLEKTIERAKAEFEKSGQKDKQIAALTATAEEYKQQLAKMQAEYDDFGKKIELLEQEAVEAQRLNEALEVANKRVRKLSRSLKQARSQTTESSLSSAIGLEGSSLGVIISDTKQKINRVNEVAARLLARPINELIHKELTSISEDAHWKKAIEQLKSTNQILVTTQLKIKETILRATISPLVATSSDDMEGTITILYDITAEFESQQARDEFVASLSQELRTPMTSITGYTDLLLAESVGNLNDMQNKFLQRVKVNVQRMWSMLNDLIGVTVIDAGQLNLHPVALDISEMVEDVMLGMRSQLEEKNISFEQQMPDGLPLVEADPDSLHQIMNNLVTNAIKVTPVKGTIAISAALHKNETANKTSLEDNQTEPQFLKIVVRDCGGGIAPKDLPRVFERFYRGDSPLIQGLGETGVGLAIVKSLVEANGGQIWVQSEMGEGTTFNFLLPVSTQSDDPWSSFLGTLPPLDLNSDEYE